MEHVRPAVYNWRSSPNFVEHFESKKINYTQNSTKTQAQIVTAFSSSIHRLIVTYVLDKDNKRAVFYWITKSLNQKARKFGLTRN